MTSSFPFQLIDLTHTLNPNVPFWSGDCGFNHQIHLDYDQCDGDVKFRVQKMTMFAGVGTHMDAAAHCIPNGATIDQIALNQLIAPCIVIDVTEQSHELYTVSEQDILSFEQQHGEIAKGSFVIIATGWEQYWQEPKRYHNHYKFPSIGAQAAELLVSRDIVGIGIDTLSPDRPDSGFPVHQILLSQNKYIVENVANSLSMPACGGYSLALPTKIAGATEATTRIVGLIATVNS